jgi:hypothetical protein
MNPEEIKTYKRNGFWGGLLLGLVIFSLIFTFVIGGSFRDFAYFLSHKDEYEKINTDFKNSFEQYAISNSKNVKKFLEDSEREQKELVSMLYDLEIPNSKKSLIMTITNREIDKQRIVTTLNHYALTEFRKNDFRETDQRIVNNVYRATGLILNSEYNKSSELLIQTYGEIESSSNDKIKVEILRYLTYSYAKMGDLKNLKYWLNKAKQIKEKNENGKKWKIYTEDYYWIDLVDLIISIKEDNVDNANKAFNCLTQNADPEFLESKFIQHELILSSNDRKKWNEYLAKLRSN